jgi:hypothetical protein
MNIKILFIAAVFSLTSQAWGASATVSLYAPTGVLTQYCTDTNGVQVNASGVFATGVTLGSCATPPPPPVNQLITGSITYQYANGTVNGVDFTRTKNIWGRVTSQDTIHEWPFRNGSTPTINMPANRVLISQFTIPADTTSLMHMIKNPSYYSSPGVTVSFSTIPGDFNPAQTACVKHNAPNSDDVMVYLRVQPTVGANRYFCYLAPGATYYLNLKFESPTRSGVITTTWN